jgi:cyclopentanol dehydrogenase
LLHLSGKAGIVTGGASGIGAAVVRTIAVQGAKVVVGDISEEKGRHLQSEVSKAGGECAFTKLDVSEWDEWQRAVKDCLDQFGRLNFLVNNAAIFSTPMVIDELPESVWDDLMRVNAKGVFLGTKAVIEPMRQSKGGSIINISSQFGIVGAAFENPAYQASKGAVGILTKVAALQYAKDGIRANSVHPGPVDTEGSTFRKYPEDAASVLSKVPLARPGKPEEIANVVAFLISDESSYMTGSQVVVDGGYTAQ